MQDVGVGIVNLAPLAYNYTGGLLLDKQIGYVPSPDWSYGLITDESELEHKISKFLGGESASFLLSFGVSKVASTVGKAGTAASKAGEAGKAKCISKIAQRGTHNTKVRSTIKRGKQAHREFAEKIKAKGKGWQSEPTIRGSDGKIMRPDGIDPKGRPIELKPNTPSGRYRGAKQIKKYRDATGTNGRVVYYNP